jgi:hypothetical protein
LEFQIFWPADSLPPTLYEKETIGILERRIASERERVSLLLPHLKIVENVSIQV